MENKGVNTCVACKETSQQVALHYTRMLCNGCRAFFKRTVQGKVKVAECKSDGQCVVDPSTRKLCKACRFEACLRAGVDVTKVQQPKEDGSGVDLQDSQFCADMRINGGQQHPLVLSSRVPQAAYGQFQQLVQGSQGVIFSPHVFNDRASSIGVLNHTLAPSSVNETMSGLHALLASQSQRHLTNNQATSRSDQPLSMWRSADIQTGREPNRFMSPSHLPIMSLSQGQFEALSYMGMANNGPAIDHLRFHRSNLLVNSELTVSNTDTFPQTTFPKYDPLFGFQPLSHALNNGSSPYTMPGLNPRASYHGDISKILENSRPGINDPQTVRNCTRLFSKAGRYSPDARDDRTRSIVDDQYERSSSRDVHQYERSSSRNVDQYERSSSRNVDQYERSSSRDVDQYERSSSRDVDQYERSSSRDVDVKGEITDPGHEAADGAKFTESRFHGSAEQRAQAVNEGSHEKLLTLMKNMKHSGQSQLPRASIDEHKHTVSSQRSQRASSFMMDALLGARHQSSVPRHNVHGLMPFVQQLSAQSLPLPAGSSSRNVTTTNTRLAKEKELTITSPAVSEGDAPQLEQLAVNNAGSNTSLYDSPEDVDVCSSDEETPSRKRILRRRRRFESDQNIKDLENGDCLIGCKYGDESHCRMPDCELKTEVAIRNSKLERTLQFPGLDKTPGNSDSGLGSSGQNLSSAKPDLKINKAQTGNASKVSKVQETNARNSENTPVIPSRKRKRLFKIESKATKTKLARKQASNLQPATFATRQRQLCSLLTEIPDNGQESRHEKRCLETRSFFSISGAESSSDEDASATGASSLRRPQRTSTPVAHTGTTTSRRFTKLMRAFAEFYRDDVSLPENSMETGDTLSTSWSGLPGLEPKIGGSSPVLEDSFSHSTSLPDKMDGIEQLQQHLMRKLRSGDTYTMAEFKVDVCRLSCLLQNAEKSPVKLCW